MQQRKRYNNTDLETAAAAVDDVVVDHATAHYSSRTIDHHRPSTRQEASSTRRSLFQINVERVLGCPSRRRRQRWWRYACRWIQNNNQNKSTRKRRIPTRLLWLLIFLFLLLLLLLLYLFVLHPYAWVYRRCFVARVVWSSLSRQIACQEASTHQQANVDPTLLWPPTLEEAYARLSWKQIRSMQNVETKLRQQLTNTGNHNNTPPAVQNIHYTITAPISNVNVRSLGLCNLEAMAHYCSDSTTVSSVCRIHIWIVDRAALAWQSEIQEWNQPENINSHSTDSIFHGNRTTTPLVSYVMEMIVLMERIFAAAAAASSTNKHKSEFQYCLRIIPDPMAYQDEDLICAWMDYLSKSKHHYRSTRNRSFIPSTFQFHECPLPTLRSQTAGRRLRAWLNQTSSAGTTTTTIQDTMTIAGNIRKERGAPTAQQSQQLIPEHASDAWRLVALLEWGGLYLDLDVIPFTSRLMHLPCETVPTQHRIGAYRVNGGVLRLGDSFLCSSSVYGHGTENNHDSRNDTSPGCFLQALEADHLWWAPRLARLSESEQTFGFLGPGALTRVAISSACRGDGQLTVLPDDVIEPVIDATICALIQTNKTTLAAHFSRSKKTIWWPLVTRYPCLEMKVRSVCPETTSELDETSES